MKEFFVHEGHSQKGPYSIDQLKSLSITKETPIWFKGLNQWTNAGDLEELSVLFSSKPAPPPLIKTVNESLAGTYVPSPQQPIPATKKKIPFLQITIVALAVLGIVVWLIFKNNKNSSTIDSLQAQVSNQQLEKQQKEAEQKKKEEEQRLANEAVAKKNLNYRNNWENYIKPDHQQPSVNYSWGGISNFNVYISNETEYMLDQVDVVVDYIRKNGDIWQTRTVSFFNVAPNSVETGVAPSSVNGVRVNISINKIVSKKMHFCYPSGGGGANDPYFCN